VLVPDPSDRHNFTEHFLEAQGLSTQLHLGGTAVAHARFVFDRSEFAIGRDLDTVGPS
jgi:hypothetical protein